MAHIFNRSALELSRAIGQRELTCREGLAALLDRIDTVDQTFHTLSSRRQHEDVLTDADQHDEEIAQGAAPEWMHGLATASKGVDISEAVVLAEVLRR